MGSCIICGTSTDGYICESHQEDVVFDFEGSHANQLTPGRFYRGSVDGFAEFGVFVDIGTSVTGLLHRSELDSRLESLDWDSGDEVYVQVTDVHDNGNVDLTWSIRQSDAEFRGVLVDTPDGDELPPEADDPNEHAVAGGPATETDETSTDPAGTAETAETVDPDEVNESTVATDSLADAGEEAADPGGAEPGSASLVEREPEPESGSASTVEYEAVTVDELDAHVDDPVRVDAEVVGVRQTGGPTVFTLRDETGTVEVAAFESAGVRAYPDVDTDALVAVEGRVERHRGGLQIEAERLVELDESDADALETRMADALAAEAEPEAVDPFADDDAMAAFAEETRGFAGVIRRAVFDDRPVVVRHDASADGYVAAAAIERATLPLIRDEHDRRDAVYHYFDRRPLDEGVYDMDSATRDVTSMLDARDRHDESIPLFVFCGVGGTQASADGLSLLSIYDAECAVLDVGVESAAIEDVTALVEPTGERTASVLAANVAAHVNPETRADLEHLPAVSFWEDAPEDYVELAAGAGYDAERTRNLREAVALVANYQSYEDKRELVRDLLFDGRESLAAGLASQFRTKRDTAVETARAHLELREGDTTVAVLDTEAFTHGYDFPPTKLLCDELFRQIRDEADVLVGIGEAELVLRHGGDLDIERVAAATADGAPEADVSVGAARDDRLEFLLGERAAVHEAVIEAVTA